MSDDAEFDAAVKRVADKLRDDTNGETVGVVQVALANIVAHLALNVGAEFCDRVFLETIDGMFEVYRGVSNLKLRNEDQTVS